MEPSAIYRTTTALRPSYHERKAQMVESSIVAGECNRKRIAGFSKAKAAITVS